MKLFRQNKSDQIDHTKDLNHTEIMTIITALMIAMFLSALDQTIVSTALPKIAVDLHSLDKLSWVATSYLIASAIVTPIYGKLGDMYGRKKIFIYSIIIFLVGSALCGMSQNMGQLVVFRALQGLGGGGLMVLVMAIVADVVPPRQRGRYQGYIGAMFGLSSVLGPLLGGLFTEHLSWHWIFYINLPVGIVALYMIATRLHLPVRKNPHKIDYLGALTLSTISVILVFISVWGGLKYAWDSYQILGLGLAFLVLTALFIKTQMRAKEPIIPLRLFKNDIFVVSVILSILSGVAMFASILYIPQYQQIVRGNSPTESGLLMLPLVAGILSSVIISGRLISKTGKYKIFPILGTLALTIGLWLYSHISLTSGHLEMSLWMFVIGAGLGAFMQVATLAVQNSVDPQDIGSATSTVTYFRSIGGSLGGAAFGTILISRLNYHINQAAPGVGDIAHSAASSGLTHIPDSVKQIVLGAYVNSFHDMFLYAIPFTALAFLVSFALRETPLRSGRSGS
jgi:EmrB/QacA subfamily drug resistance transporter